jgi:hypothetical protein
VGENISDSSIGWWGWRRQQDYLTQCWASFILQKRIRHFGLLRLGCPTHPHKQTSVVTEGIWNPIVYRTTLSGGKGSESNFSKGNQGPALLWKCCYCNHALCVPITTVTSCLHLFPTPGHEAPECGAAFRHCVEQILHTPGYVTHWGRKEVWFQVSLAREKLGTQHE